MTLWQNERRRRVRTRAEAAEIPSAYAEFRETKYFRALDGMRALSIGLVLLHHMGTSAGALDTLAENGRYGVGFFFLISGFLICTLLLREEEATGQIDLWRFYGRRALRLFPLYYGMLLVACFLVFGLRQYSEENRELFRQKLPAYAFYYSNWLATASVGPFFCAWSLAVEEQFYIAFSLLLCFFRRRTIILIVAWALAVKMITYLTLGAVDARSAICRILFSYREPILVGVLLGFALHERRTFEKIHNWFGRTWITGAASMGAMGWFLLHRMKHESAWDAQLLYALMALVLIGLVLRPNTAGISARFPVHVGKVSYGIYLLHLLVLNGFSRLAPHVSAVGVFAMSSTATIVLATLLYQYFERPISAWYKSRQGRELFPAWREAHPIPIPITIMEMEPAQQYVPASANERSAPSRSYPSNNSLHNSPKLPI